MTTGSAVGTLPPAPLEALNTEPNLSAPDEFYQELIDMHRVLSEQQSALVNAKLILLLANHVGTPAVLREAMRAARADIAPQAEIGDATAGSHDVN